jgi:hypothetical protein
MFVAGAGRKVLCDAKACFGVLLTLIVTPAKAGAHKNDVENNGTNGVYGSRLSPG